MIMLDLVFMIERGRLLQWVLVCTFAEISFQFIFLFLRVDNMYLRLLSLFLLANVTLVFGNDEEYCTGILNWNCTSYLTLMENHGQRLPQMLKCLQYDKYLNPTSQFNQTQRIVGRIDLKKIIKLDEHNQVKSYSFSPKNDLKQVLEPFFDRFWYWTPESSTPGTTGV